jgi:hypothetical protein
MNSGTLQRMNPPLLPPELIDLLHAIAGWARTQERIGAAACPPWRPDLTGHLAGERDDIAASYTTSVGTITFRNAATRLVDFNHGLALTCIEL